MPDETIPAPALPEGETDPNVLYAAVGRAIHRWENMELALARLYVILSGLPDRPDSYVPYGTEYRKFSMRKVAVERAAEKFFVSRPDQMLEGELRRILQTLDELAIVRHRIAHGHITMWTEISLPSPLPERGTAFEMRGTILYRWGAPFYSIGSLRTDPVGIGGAAVENLSAQFETVHNEIFRFTESLLGPSPAPCPSEERLHIWAGAPPGAPDHREAGVPEAPY